MTVTDNIKFLKNKIFDTAVKCGRDPSEIKLVAVSKMVEAEKIIEAANAGIEFFGENYIYEAVEKITSISEQGYNLSWHYIGHLQSNKAKEAVRYFNLIHSIDKLSTAITINKLSAENNKIQYILVQVNISKEVSKSGINEETIYSFIEELSNLKNIRVCGFMTIPPFHSDPESSRPYFSSLRMLKEKMQKSFPSLSLTELSMGMSSDFTVAIEEGATIVRIGTAIFGERKKI